MKETLNKIISIYSKNEENIEADELISLRKKLEKQDNIDKLIQLKLSKLYESLIKWENIKNDINGFPMIYTEVTKGKIFNILYQILIFEQTTDEHPYCSESININVLRKNLDNNESNETNLNKEIKEKLRKIKQKINNSDNSIDSFIEILKTFRIILN